VECASLDEVMGLNTRLAQERPAGVMDIVPAARTVLVVTEGVEVAARLRPWLATLAPLAWQADTAQPVTIEVVYDGEDLEWVASYLGLSNEGVVQWHTQQIWRCAFTGFAPGFAYCAGEDSELAVPRRPSPRLVVPAGSVGLAGEFSAIYPKASPGGWQLIGRTTAELWNTARDTPALIGPGDPVRYVAVREVATITVTEPQLIAATPPDHAGELERQAARTDPARLSTDGSPLAALKGPSLEIVSPGWQSLIEDQGRRNLAHLGISPSGAWDAAAAAAASTAVSGGPEQSVIETLGTVVVQAHGDVIVAWSDGEVLLGPVTLHEGQQFTTPEGAWRGYLAVADGFNVPQTLGSCSYDALAGLGPTPLRVGDLVSVGGAAASQERETVIGTRAATNTVADGPLVLNVTLGPRDDWVTPEALASLLTQEWEVSSESNRVGVRLLGTPLQRSVTAELPSEGTVAGAVELPPNGLPLLLMRDHPVTGGYPVIAVIDDAGINALAHATPGTKVRFAC
jgi:KipI family sensor histidine kinase inhibitor